MAWNRKKQPSRFGAPVAEPPHSWRFKCVEVKTPGQRLTVGELYYRHDGAMDSLCAFLEGDTVKIIRVCRVTSKELGAVLELAPAASSTSWVAPAMGAEGEAPSTTKWANEAGWIFRLSGSDHSSAYLEAPARVD